MGLDLAVANVAVRGALYGARRERRSAADIEEARTVRGRRRRVRGVRCPALPLPMRGDPLLESARGRAPSLETPPQSIRHGNANALCMAKERMYVAFLVTGWARNMVSAP